MVLRIPFPPVFFFRISMIFQYGDFDYVQNTRFFLFPTFRTHYSIFNIVYDIIRDNLLFTPRLFHKTSWLLIDKKQILLKKTHIHVKQKHFKCRICLKSNLIHFHRCLCFLYLGFLRVGQLIYEFHAVRVQKAIVRHKSNFGILYIIYIIYIPYRIIEVIDHFGKMCFENE